MRERLAPLVDSEGLPLPETRALRLPLPEDVLARVRASSDLDELERLCRGDDVALVHEAALRLLVLGEAGSARLASCLETLPTTDQARPIVESLALWEEGPALVRARACMFDTSRPSELQFRVALGLLERKEAGCFEVVIARALAPFVGKSWFEARDWQRLVAHASEQTVACALATSPHARAYLRAVEVLLARDEGAACLHALRAFLETGTTRLGSLRRTAAQHLLSRGDACGFPLCVQQELELDRAPSTLFSGVSGRLVEAATRGFLAAGNTVARETSLLLHLSATGIDPAVLEAATAVVLTEATVDAVRQKAANRLHANPFGMRRMQKLHRVADTFAWGVRKGAELLGRKYKVEMTGGASLGHTRLRESRIFVTPLPILKNERFGREIVEALILHELGHHLYHRGKEAEAIWDKAQKEGLHGLLNLVADEHLERNLRAIEPSYGDRLKRLAAFAFQHTSREIDLNRLLGHLGGRAFAVLHTTRLGVGKDEGSVTIDSGELLGNMERSALAFSRFVRALRMGLGNRHDDPRVARALELFAGGFRHLDMAGLLKITYELRDIFGWETELVESFGPHESLETSASEEAVWGDGISAEEVEREVQRVLDPKSERNEGEAGKPGGPPWINIAPTADFERINVVQPLAVDPVLQAEFVFFNCGAVVEATDFFATIHVRASPSGAPVTDFVKTDILVALEEASEHMERRYLVFLDEFNRCQESARNALMPALDSTRRVFHPIKNTFIEISDNVQFIAAVNRGNEFSGTFGIDAAQLDRFAPLQMDYPPPEEEVKLLANRHPELPKGIIEEIVALAVAVRRAPELRASLSVRATEEACVYLKHPLFEGDQRRMMGEVLKSSFCGRFSGRFDDLNSDAGMAWSVIQKAQRERK